MKILVLQLLFLSVIFFAVGQSDKISQMKHFIEEKKYDSGLIIIDNVVAKKKGKVFFIIIRRVMNKNQNYLIHQLFLPQLLLKRQASRTHYILAFFY